MGRIIKRLLRSVALVAVVAAQLPEPRTEALTFASLFGWDDPDLAAARAVDDERRVQHQITACMEAHGFSYVPFVPELEAVIASTLSPQAFASQYGFGIVHQPPPLTVSDDDPNKQVLDSLSPNARETYVSALYSEPSHGSYGGGCAGAANELVHSHRDTLLAPVRKEMAAIQREVDRDPRVAAAADEWVGCMRRAGVGLGSRADLRTTIETEVLIPLRSISRPDSAGIEMIAARERALAVVTYRCDQALMAVQLATSGEYEAEFIRVHRGELDEIRRAAYPSG